MLPTVPVDTGLGAVAGGPGEIAALGAVADGLGVVARGCVLHSTIVG